MMLYIKGLLQDMGEPTMDIAILTDSKSSVGTAYSPISARYRYISVTITFLKQLIAQENLKLVHLPRQNNFADLMTKQNDVQTYKMLKQLAFSPFQWTHRKKGHGVRQSNKVDAQRN